MPDAHGMRMVRGGTGETILRSALLLYAERGRPGVSVFAAELDDVALAEAVRDALPHQVVRFGWLRCLREKGFEVEQTGRPWHYTVWFPDVHAVTIRAFLDCFEPPVPNPLVVG